jgi:hypothetical protein
MQFSVGILVLGWQAYVNISPPLYKVAVVYSVVKHELSCPLAFDCLCNCCGLISRMGQSGAYMTLSMTNMMFYLFSWCILSFTVPLPRAVRPPAIPFSVVFCICVG